MTIKLCQKRIVLFFSFSDTIMYLYNGSSDMNLAAFILPFPGNIE